MFQKLISLFRITSFVLLLQCCTNKIICYDSETCLKKYNVSLLIEEKNQKFLSIIIKNKSLIKIDLTDSLVLKFYRYNINLKQEHYDSSLANIQNKIFISRVLYEQPIEFYLMSYPYHSVIENERGYEIKIPTDPY